LVALLRGADSRRWREARVAVERDAVLALLEAEHGLLAEAELQRAAEQIAAWNARGILVRSPADGGYPDNLRSLPDRPPLLFVAGQLTPEDERSVAVVGTRRPSDAGLAAAREIASELVTGGYTVYSGLATGIDTAAHMAALRAGGRTVAVIGTGLDHCFPPGNASLQRQIARDCAVVSQFWPEDPPSRHSFPMRNALMAGISLTTVIVEASATSGTRIQARAALAQGRPVILLQSLLEQDWALDLASRPGVSVIDSPGGIAAALAQQHLTIGA
jgi:DNA processing protein